jgi:TonB-dependent SusC/RagA subfamily outer membrane receptor
MKTAFVLMFSILLISRSLMGQTDKFKFDDSKMKRGSSVSSDLYNNQLDANSCIIRNLDPLTVIGPQKFGSGQNNFFQDPLKNELYRNMLTAEEFPGSSKYYARRPSLNFSPYQKSFSLKPDASAKYFLHIIPKPPLLQNNLVPKVIIINGLVSNNGMNGINPNDIQSISVIKDKRTIDNYGEKGSNGVIVVTTKKRAIGSDEKK